ncbi:putative pantothenate transporter [Truncatella angustata]|uniref:Pantothenate transporter n=1 Tax=Truncatella angustata TaxID=152316 RepID=A0A9P8UTF8_9PEZI|nr:putative pantothenate transporter [Truncatella angustata]KAH6658034.1 putative pantothenate transporter [Truncatella angustata]
MSQTIEAEESPKVLDQSSTSEQGSSASDRKKERRVRWKTDLIILPLLVSIHFLAQMGRSDLANAKVAGMEEDLHLTPSMYSLTASIFLVGYLVFQLPAMLLMRKVGPPVEFACAMIVWGVVTVCTMKATNQAQLMVCRTLIGASEAFIQGAVLYLSFWYPYTELATRGAIFYSSVALAGSFNGLLAYLIEGNLDGANGWAAYFRIFFIEGLVPMVWAFVILILLPSTPETVKWYFKAEEKEIVIRRSRAAHNTGESKIIPRLIFKVLTQPQFWMVALIDSGSHFCTTSFSNFVPDIIKGLGFESIQAQLMTVIVYASAFVGIIIAARIADKTQKRGILISICASYAVVGYILLLTVTNNTIRLVGTCIVAAGVYPITLLSLVWVATNNVGYTYRASTAGLINVFAQLVAISSNFAYSDPPYYQQGLAISLAMVSMSGLVAGLQWLYLRRMNRKKAEQQYSAEANNKRSLSIDEIGNAHPDFFFSY